VCVCDRVVCVLDLVCLKLNLNFVLVLPKFATALAYNSFSIVCVCIRFTFKSILIISILGFFFPFSYDSLFFLCFFPLLLDFCNWICVCLGCTQKISLNLIYKTLKDFASRSWIIHSKCFQICWHGLKRVCVKGS